MGDTMKSMEMKKVDELVVESLEIGDNIGYNMGIVEVVSIRYIDESESFLIEFIDEWGELLEDTFKYGWVVDFYYPVEEED
jgi:hypothetical protein